jgi:hypothetical protein
MGRVRLLDKKPVFLVMDYLLTALAIALVCLAGWLLYKRWVGRYRQRPVETCEDEDHEDYEETQVAAPAPTPAEPEPEPEAAADPEEKKNI